MTLWPCSTYYKNFFLAQIRCFDLIQMILSDWLVVNYHYGHAQRIMKLFRFNTVPSVQPQHIVGRHGTSLLKLACQCRLISGLKAVDKPASWD